MPKLKSSILVNAPIEHCYKLCTSFDLLVKFMQQSNAAIEFEVDPEPRGMSFSRGVTHRIESKNSPMKLRMLVRVEEEREPNLLVLSGEQSLQSSYKMSYHLSKNQEQTLIKMEIDFKPMKGILGRLFSPVALFLQLTALGVWGQFLKEAAESEAGEFTEFSRKAREQNIIPTSAKQKPQEHSRLEQGSFEQSSVEQDRSTQNYSTQQSHSKQSIPNQNSQTEGISPGTLLFVIALIIGAIFIWKG